MNKKPINPKGEKAKLKKKKRLPFSLSLSVWFISVSRHLKGILRVL
jgi:hypothetical protein